MAIYAIGDLQGCYDPFRRLLDALHFDPSRDRLWLTGDLVNRGPNSLATLRFVQALGDRAVTVLGNHDLHLLALSERPKRSLLRKRSDLRSILEADDAEGLLDWLRRRPLIHFDKGLNKLMVHAGVHPKWSLKKARKLAREVEGVLRGDDYHALMLKLYGDKPALWRDDLEGVVRWRYIINVCTRMRMVTGRGGLDLKRKGPPSERDRHRMPWFEAPHKRGNVEVLFGHWSALGFVRRNGVVGLDTGCVWGRELTALRLDGGPHEPVGVPRFRT